MNATELKHIVHRELNSKFSGITVRFESFSGEEGDIVVAVYGAEENLVDSVRDFICDLSWDLCRGKGFLLTPVVVGLEVTRSVYPELLPKRPETVELEIATIEEVFADGSWLQFKLQHCDSLAAGEELALAA